MWKLFTFQLHLALCASAALADTKEIQFFTVDKRYFREVVSSDNGWRCARSDTHIDIVSPDGQPQTSLELKVSRILAISRKGDCFIDTDEDPEVTDAAMVGPTGLVQDVASHLPATTALGPKNDLIYATARLNSRAIRVRVFRTQQDGHSKEEIEFSLKRFKEDAKVEVTSIAHITDDIVAVVTSINDQGSAYYSYHPKQHLVLYRVSSRTVFLYRIFNDTTDTTVLGKGWWMARSPQRAQWLYVPNHPRRTIEYRDFVFRGTADGRYLTFDVAESTYVFDPKTNSVLKVTCEPQEVFPFAVESLSSDGELLLNVGSQEHRGYGSSEYMVNYRDESRAVMGDCSIDSKPEYLKLVGISAK